MKRSPAMAFWLSIIPGAGFVYLGQTLKGVTVLVLIVSSMQIADRGADAFGMLALVLLVFSMIDAHRSAVESNHLLETGRTLPKAKSMRLGRSWGWVLIALGAFFTLDNFGWFDLDWIFDLWPLALIALGVYLLRQPEPVFAEPGPEPGPQPTDDAAPPPVPAGDAPIESEEAAPAADDGSDLAMNLDADAETDAPNA